MTPNAMNACVACGDAERLFADDPVGPVLYVGRWWAISEQGISFEPVTDPRVAAGLDRAAARLRAAGIPTVRGQ